MIKYTIDYSYKTGDSFNTYIENETLECSWTDFDVIKENLKRIKEQYEWYKYNNRHRFSDDPIIKRPSWLPPKSELGRYENEKYILILKMDNGNDWKISAPWCGYFEKLLSAKIVMDDNDLEIEF